MFKDTELYKHAVTELNILLELERKENANAPIEELDRECEIFNGMTPQEYMNNQILNVIASINSPELSSSTLQYLLNTVYTLCQFQNLTPLTLDDNEFEEVAEDATGEKLYQNKRNFNVFKTASKGVYHLDGPAALNEALGIAPGEDMPDTI